MSLSPFECLSRNFILPEPASYVFFYAVFNLRNLLYLIALSGVTSCKYLNNAKTPSREITRWRFLTKHVSYVNT